MATIKNSELQFNQIEEISDEDLTSVVGGCDPSFEIPTVKVPTCAVKTISGLLGKVGSTVDGLLDGGLLGCGC